MHFDKFPTAMPVEEITLIIGYLKGSREHDVKCVAGSCWWVAGYGLSFISPGEMRSLPAAADSELQGYLESAIAGGEGVRAVPWELIIPLLIKLAERLLK